MKLFWALSALLVLTWNRHAEAACGYKACPASKANMINVHLVPHSHDDTGWLKTVDQYYYGSRNGIQHAGVQYILDSVITELLKDSKRRFIQVESAFFFKWYNQQTSAVQKNVKTLIDGGRLEFTGGAWSMNDEAAVHYQSVIDHFTLGLKTLSATFGACARPRVGWQIDPFGHSREMASLFAQMGFDGEFFARMDYMEKNERLNNMTGEVIWKASENLNSEISEIFTGVLYNHYSAPPGFCFDNLCSDDPIIDGNSYDNNVKTKVDDFITYINKMAKYYRATDLLVPMGDDFNYENAAINYGNMDKLIKYVNERQVQGTKINVFYSTPACYLNAVHNTIRTWPTKTQDFFPYSTDWHTYWTGYYSSRPTQKRFEREGNHFLQVAKQLTTIANLTSAAVTQNVDKLRQAMGIMQHHDAITGTEKQHVAYDYDRMLTDAINAVHNNTRDALQKLSNLTSGEFASCLQLNMSICEYSQHSPNNLVVTLVNPLAHHSMQYVRIPVKNGTYNVTDIYGKIVQSEVVPLPKEVVDLTHLRANVSQHELVFYAYVEKISHYYIKTVIQPRGHDEVSDESQAKVKMPRRFMREERTKTEKTVEKIEPKAVGDVVVQNSLIKLTFNSNGILYNIQMNGITENINQEFYYYKGAYGNNMEFKNRSSGAYIFRPNGTEVLVSPKATLTIYNGNMVKEVHQRFNEWVSQVIRIYNGINRVEFEWLVGPIPITDGIGKEVITRFTTSINNAGVFYTDSNGREMLRRIRNGREYFKPNLTESVSGNYYPVTARIAMENAKSRLALLNDRAQGGSSVKDGSLELMLHRRLLRDDAFGVGEALNETVNGKGLVARGKVYLILSPTNQAQNIYERMAQQEIHLPFWKFFSNATKSTNKVPPRILNFNSLPVQVQVLTLEPYSPNEHLLRLENYMDKNETSATTFSVRTLFDMLHGTEIRETTLDGNLALGSMSRFKFQPDGKTPPNKVEYYTSKYTPLTAVAKDPETKFRITMDPMQIRTFIIKWK
ncbi:lysosomal alpha-mannosidase [Stomoxys calcitrans]|uniref:lysosomal alpha-mannosidase n=1 Tax=Stomoxys calcitrans TaxID=35570 RepID=UPI0027E39217|nr:lysosomal alpha-mannosidase [Stomoxys calcitrans]